MVKYCYFIQSIIAYLEKKDKESELFFFKKASNAFKVHALIDVKQICFVSQVVS
jgi:hypothetical protein